MVDDETVRIYEAGAGEWAVRRRPRLRGAAQAFAATVPAHELRVDLGCGPGSYAPDLGRPLVALDAAGAMLQLTRRASPDALCVQADLERLPFVRGAFGGAWARASYLHVRRVDLPLALAELHRVTRVGAPIAVSMKRGEYEGAALPDDDFPGRFFACWEPRELASVVTGAGFDLEAHETTDEWVHLRVRRARTLPDFVGGGMALLICGLNPSPYAADAGVGFARPGNRFWPAALAAGLVTRDRDPWAALRDHRVGMTDLVKRVTVGAKELTRAEYHSGAERVEELVEWLRPGAMCFVGLAGYRAAVERTAAAGLQARTFGGVPAYLMPNTSGLNARVPLSELADHLLAARGLAGP